jgi:nucleotide sugar dehydrogenase
MNDTPAQGTAPMERLAVVGLGKMGLPVAVQFAHSGFQVVGVDSDSELVRDLSAGTRTFANEPGLDDVLSDVVQSRRFKPSTDLPAAVRGSDTIIVLVRAVVDDAGEPDYTNLDAVTQGIGKNLRKGQMVIYETTLPVGDTRSRFKSQLEELSGLTGGVDFNLCFSPERVSAGTVFHDLQKYPKVIGGLTSECSARADVLYKKGLGAVTLIVDSPEAAELAKVAEAMYRDVNIALANEIAKYADQLGIQYGDVAAAANSQPYSHLHIPGLGVGGHCIPVYPRFFIARAHDSELTRTGRAINDGMPEYAVKRLSDVIGDIRGRHVLVLGLAFRGNVPEIGFSMAWPLIEELTKAGAVVRVNDALLGPDAIRGTGLEWGDIDSDWAEIAVLQAMHDDYAALSPARLPGVQVILDGRGTLSPDAWKSVTYLRIGG